MSCEYCGGSGSIKVDFEHPQWITCEACKPCCEYWPKICGLFQYMQVEGESDLIMPHITQAGTKWRVNHCPACGAEISGRHFDAEDIERSRNGMEGWWL